MTDVDLEILREKIVNGNMSVGKLSEIRAVYDAFGKHMSNGPMQ